MNKKDNKNKKSGIFNKILFVVALLVFIYSAYQLYTIFAEYREGEKEYADVLELVVTHKDKKDENNSGFQVDFDALKSINGDAMGWIRFDEPSIISYPLVQGKDNYEYLKSAGQLT